MARSATSSSCSRPSAPCAGARALFMVGIGSAPNSFLMTRAAELGRGTFTHIGSVDQVEERMRSAVRQAREPGGDQSDGDVPGGARGCEPRGAPRSLPGRAFGARRQGRRACRHAGDQGHDRRPAVGGHAAAGRRRRRPRPVEALGAAQDRRRRGRPHAAADHAGRGRPADSRARSRAPSGDAIDQPGRRRPDAEPSRWRASEPCRGAAQPPGRLGVRQGVRRRAPGGAGPGGTPRRGHAGRLAQLDGYAAVTASRSPKLAAAKPVRRPARAAARRCRRPRPTRSCACGSASCSARRA